MDVDDTLGGGVPRPAPPAHAQAPNVLRPPVFNPPQPLGAGAVDPNDPAGAAGNVPNPAGAAGAVPPDMATLLGHILQDNHARWARLDALDAARFAAEAAREARQRRFRRDICTPPNLGGVSPQHWQTFITHFEDCRATNEWDDEVSRVKLRSCVQANPEALARASSVPAKIAGRDDYTYEEMRTSMARLFTAQATSDAAMKDFWAARQQAAESVLDYAGRVEGLATLALPVNAAGVIDPIYYQTCCIHVFRSGLLNDRVRESVCMSTANTIAELAQVALSMEYSIKISASNRQSSAGLKAAGGLLALTEGDAAKAEEVLTESLAALRFRSDGLATCHSCGSADHWARNCPRRVQSQNPSATAAQQQQTNRRRNRGGNNNTRGGNRGRGRSGNGRGRGGQRGGNAGGRGGAKKTVNAMQKDDVWEETPSTSGN